MSATVLDMSMTLDGFITGPNVSPDNGLGDGGERLHEWVFAGRGTDDLEASAKQLKGANRQVFDELMATGAVVAGRATFEPAGGWNGDHHDGVPIFILSRNPAPEWAAKWPLVTYTADLAGAMRQAKEHPPLRLLPPRQRYIRARVGLGGPAATAFASEDCP